MTRPTHGYLTEPEWRAARNAPAASRDLVVMVLIALVAAGAASAWSIFSTGAMP